MKTIYSSSNEEDLLILKEMLENQNIKTNILRKGAGDYLHITGGDLISNIELQVMPSDVKKAQEIIKTTEYCNGCKQERQSNYDEMNGKKHTIDKKTIFARAMLGFMAVVIIIYIILGLF